MKTKLIKLAALTLGLFAGAALHAATDGNIYQILPCDEMGVALEGPVSSIAIPKVPGETLYFKVRLARTPAMLTAGRQWRMEYVGTGSPTVDAITSPFSLGIYVSGKLTFAKYVGYQDFHANVRDFIFKYTVELGDFALPVRLATSTGPAGFQEVSTSYVILNSDKFNIVDVDSSTDPATVTPAKLLFNDPAVPVGATGEVIIDYSLAGYAGFYLKSIDFENTQEDVGIWRVIPSGSTRTTGIRIESTAALTNAVSLYVWSEDENIVRVTGGETVSMVVGYDAGTQLVKSVTVGTVKIARGESFANFSLTAGDISHVGQVTNVVLSAYKGYFFDDSNEKFTDYLTAKVMCGEPDPPNVRITSADSTIVADYDYLTAKTTLAVSLNNYTVGSGEQVVVTINPTFQDGAVTNWWDYVYFSTQDSEQTITPTQTKPEITFTAASGNTRTIYVYALRSDSHTVGTGRQVQFTPSVTGSVSAITSFTPAGLYISSGKPVVTNPTEGSTLSAVAGSELEIEAAIEDVYADMISTNGYIVKIKVGAKTTTFAETFVPSGEDNILRGVDSNDIPTVMIPDTESEGLKAATILVTSPITGKTSELRTFNVQVTVQDQVHVDASLVGKAEGENVYYEGDQVPFRATFYNNNGEVVPNPNGTVLYAYLVANGLTDLSMFGGTAVKCIVADETVEDTATDGRMIYPTANNATGSFTVLDGLSVGDGGMNYIFSVVICTTSHYDPDSRVTEIKAGQGLDILVYNKEPKFTTVYLNGFEADTGDGHVYGNKYPRGQALQIQPEFDDAAYDLKNGFTYKWTASCNGVAVANGTVTNAVGTSINDTPFTYNFPQAGIWTVKIQMKDKDMTKFAAETFSFSVEILSNPRLSVTPSAESILETDNRASIDVSLGFYQASAPIWVRLTVTPPTGANPGRLVLEDTYKIRPDGAVESDPNVYYIQFTSANATRITVDELDGTPLTIGSKTFTARAEVVSTEMSIDPTKTWAEYYEPFASKIYIENVTPVFMGVSGENSQSNAFQVAGGSATSYPIKWGIRSDVDGDITGLVPAFPGLRITFTGCENATSFYVTEGDDMSGSFVPNFGSTEGPKNVTLTIEDKDGGYQTWTYFYEVQASKFLYTKATGPSGGTTTSSLSQRYARQTVRAGQGGGLGQGHVFVRGATFSSADNFELAWNCSRNKSMTVYGFGYRVGALDNGSLNASRDVAIDPIGYSDGSVPAAFYAYPDATYDSFFYTWVLTTLDESGMSANTILGNTLAPESRLGNPASGEVPLPTAETQDGGFVKTSVEAIFSREWRPADNAGDINADGVPDLFAVKVWSGSNLSLIETATGGDTLANDLANLSQANPAQDKLPGVLIRQWDGSFQFQLGRSYAPIGPDFGARLKIRGFHDGLNATDVTLSTPDFSADEGAAWNAFAAANGLDPVATNLTVWSPEPGRMDPTTDDTDGDGFPDGWEYFFWYQARVWAPADNGFGRPLSGQQFVFERFNPANILRGTVISNEEVMAHFDPCVPLEGVNRPDFDMDGLADVEELAIGTNPCHWDTDGDHMCDGWEVMMSLDPVGPNKAANPDGDFMAYFETTGILSVEATETIGGVPRTVFYFDIDQQLQQGADYDYVPRDAYQDAVNGRISQSPTSLGGTANIPLYTDNVSFLMTTNAVDAGGVANERYQTYFMVTLRDVVLTRALKIIPKYNADGTAYTYGLALDEEITGEIPETWHWGYPMAENPYPLDQRWMNQNVAIPANTEASANNTFVLIHDQVKAAFGFDPRTGWYVQPITGRLADRWDPEINDELSPFDTVGLAVNTDLYCNYDEYLLMRYRLDYRMAGYTAFANGQTSQPGPYHFDDARYDADNLFATMRGYTTQPAITFALTDLEAFFASTNAAGLSQSASTNLVVQANIAEYLAAAFSQAGSLNTVTIGHGADTDRDGVPDGWELYNGRNPNAPPGIRTVTEGFQSPWDADRDLLGYVAEFASTDGCNAYRSCATIYDNHPGNASGWFNKFFPTDPDNADTDGDGVGDASEGSFWKAIFTINGHSYLLDQGFVYGQPADSITRCVRGGGMNPCAVDTDYDGLPDGWEMTFAGVPIDLSLRDYSPPVGSDTEVNLEIGIDTWMADGILVGGPTTGFYIAGGMDATWGGDAWTDIVEDGNSFDTITGTARDVDFDHDGLENYQEYLVQTLRHLRYDDITTPLNGRILNEGTYNSFSLRLDTDHTQEYKGVIPMNTGSPSDMAYAAATAWTDSPNVVQISTNLVGFSTVTNLVVLGDGSTSNRVLDVANYAVVTNFVSGDVADLVRGVNTHAFANAWTETGWRRLGYFASPSHGWDPMITCMQFAAPVLLLPPSGAGYVSTDPRSADSDADGLDDFYELYHGLNPLLGSATPGANDVIASAYGANAFYNAFWNEWLCPDFSRLYALEFLDVATVARNTAVTGPAALDPVLYPWTSGIPEADPDGDGLRNGEERILANMASPSATHTDPTPFWFTDTTSPRSFVSQYYRNAGAVAALPFGPPMPLPAPSVVGYTQDWLYSIEENEGYDTDNDWVPDGREIVKTIRSATDPLDHADPARRQALYLDGVNSYALSRKPHYRTSDAADLLTQFTVETWVQPEETGRAQTIIDRSAFYTAAAITKDNGAIRSNFRIGLHQDGRVYGMFDNTDSIESGLNPPVSCQAVTSVESLRLGEWSHVALSYDGKELKLFVNGQMVGFAQTSLKPANGVTQINQDPSTTNTFVSTSYVGLPCAFFIGARPQKQNVVSLYPIHPLLPGLESFGNVREFFKGYVDEVRVWDGARTATEIGDNYRRRFSVDTCATNRLEVYTAWLDGKTRNDNDGNENLPPELIQHYTFGNLPGAAAATDVAKAPVGFIPAVIEQAENPYTSPEIDSVDSYPNRLALKGTADGRVRGGLGIGWWETTRLHSTVYDDYRVLPWIENTVAHLPMLDGSCWDSFLYSELLGGKYMTAAQQGVKKFAFPNGSVPYDHQVFCLERWRHEYQLSTLADAGYAEEYTDLFNKYEFEIRSRFVNTSDLVPLGGAFAKTSPSLWDGQGPSDAWENTGTDSDVDGLPDWWEAIAVANYSPEETPLNWNTMVTYGGHRIPAWEAYLRDLSKGMQPDGTVSDSYRSVADGDGDGLPDWWQNIYAITGGADDADGDGLSNYVEYLLSEVFSLGLRFDPTNPYSVQPYVSDYFYRLNQLYVGEVVTDHDRIKDGWERLYLAKSDLVSPYQYDCVADPDGDGWTNEDEFQAGTDPTLLGSLGIDAVQMNEYPISTIEFFANYDGDQNVAGVPLVVKAWSDPKLESIPDAVWNVGAAGTTTITQNGNSNTVNGIKYIGMNPRREMLIHLSPGSVASDSVSFEFKDTNWMLINPTLNQYYVMDGETAIWMKTLIDRKRINEVNRGDIIDKITETVVGEIDYETGAVTIDFNKVPQYEPIVGDISGSYTDAGWYSIYNNYASYIRVNWYSKPITGGSSSTYYLSDADARAADNNSLGHVKRGRNTFVAFYDLDGDGKYTAGEPYGVAPGVNVGWNYAKVSVNLTDTHPVFARFKAIDSASGTTGTGGTTGGSGLGLNDREVIYGTQSGNLDPARITAGLPSGGTAERIRVVRTMVDGLNCETKGIGLPARVVLDKEVSVYTDGYITEADFLKGENAFDVDWEFLSADIAASIASGNGSLLSAMRITNVTYRIVMGNGSVSNSETNNLLGLAVSRRFDDLKIIGAPELVRPIAIGPGVVNSASPTFSWYVRNGFNTYTAFQLRLMNASGTVIWTSPFERMPPRVKDSQYGWRYDWKAPFYADDLLPDNATVFVNGTNYQWDVRLVNARYRDLENWSTPAAFRMDVQTNSTDYGTIDVAVRYYGPSTVATSGVIRVQAFTTPDFSGDVVAQGYVADRTDLASTNAIRAANVRLHGLKNGTYYLRAFIDTDRSCTFANWESHGAFCIRDTKEGTLFTIKSVKVGPSLGSRDLIPIFLEDSDTDQDHLPDAWEWIQTGGSLMLRGSTQLDQAAGGFAMNTALSGAISANGLTTSGLSSLITASVSSPYVAAMLLDVEVVNGEDPTPVLALAAAKTEVLPGSFAVTGLALDTANRQVKLTVDADVGSTLGDSVASAFYTFSAADTLTVTCKVWYRETLAENWQIKTTAENVVLGRDAKDVTIDLGNEVDLSSGFFKVTLEQ